MLLAGTGNAADTQINIRAWRRMPESINSDDNPNAGLRYHVHLFSDYGDSLMDW